MPENNHRVICEVMAGVEEGGLENHFFELANGLATAHEVHVVAHARYAEQFTAPVQFHPLDLGSSRHNPVTLWRLARTLRAIAPDVVHAHASKAAAMISLIRPWLPCPAAVTVHSVKRNTSVYRAFDPVIAVSEGVARSLHNVTATVIYNGRTLTPLTPQPSPVRSPAKVLMIARLVDVKRVDLALQAIATTQHIELNIAGEGPLRQHLESLAHHLGIAERVHFLGFRDDIPDLIKSADAVLISSDREGFPLAMVETLLLGKPVVSTRVAGAVEFLPSRYLADTGNVPALAAALHQCVTQPQQTFEDFQPVWKIAARRLTFAAQLKATASILTQTADKSA